MDYSTSQTDENSPFLSRYSGLAISLAMTVLLVTAIACYSVEQSIRRTNYEYFVRLTHDAQSALHERFMLYEESLRGSLGLFYASQFVDRDEWRAYVKALEIEKTLPGINGMGYIEYVKQENLDTYLTKIHESGLPNFKNHPATDFPDKMVIQYIEPLEKNIEALGLDIGFEQNRRAAAEKSRDEGIPVLTKAIELVQDHEKQSGFLLLIPVYGSKKLPPTIEERQRDISGWVYAPFMSRNFLTDFFPSHIKELKFDIYDGDKIDHSKLIYSSYAEQSAQIQAADKNGFSSMEIFPLAATNWTIHWHSSDEFKPPTDHKLTILIGIFGALFSFFIYTTFHRIVRTKEKTELEVLKRTKALREAADFRDLITNSIPDLVFVKDEKFRIIDANEAFLNLYPKKIRDSVIGSTTIEHYDEKEAEEFLRYDKQALEMGYSETEESITFPDGYIRTLMTKKVRFEDADGNRFILAIARDISEAKYAQEQILRANEELKRSNQELERFAYIASHDLQEPLRKIGGFTERLAIHLEGQLDEKSLNYMHFITGGVERMRELIQGLLAYSRITTLEIKKKKQDTNKIVSEVIDTLSEMITENEAQIHYKDLPEVAYDKVMLSQLFQNLINNAIKYRSKKPPEITITAKTKKTHFEFAIKDNGMGMEKKHLDRIFEMFQRLHRKEDIAGTGIGLSLCQKIVERYGGEIWVTSEVGEGSTFYFTIPK